MTNTLSKNNLQKFKASEKPLHQIDKENVTVKLSTKLIISFVLIQSVELYIFNSLLDKAQQATSQAAAPLAQPEITPPNSTPQLIALEKEIAQLRAQLLATSTPQHTLNTPQTKITPQKTVNDEEIQAEKEDSYETDIFDNAENEQAYYATTQTLESAIASGYWTEHDTNMTLENRHKLTEKQLSEITEKFYMHLDGGKLEIRSLIPPF